MRAGNEAAIAAAQRWEYEPTKVNGKAVSADVEDRTLLVQLPGETTDARPPEAGAQHRDQGACARLDVDQRREADDVRHILVPEGLYLQRNEDLRGGDEHPRLEKETHRVAKGLDGAPSGDDLMRDPDPEATISDPADHDVHGRLAAMVGPSDRDLPALRLGVHEAPARREIERAQGPVHLRAGLAPHDDVDIDAESGSGPRADGVSADKHEVGDAGQGLGELEHGAHARPEILQEAHRSTSVAASASSRYSRAGP